MVAVVGGVVEEGVVMVGLWEVGEEGGEGVVEKMSDIVGEVVASEVWRGEWEKCGSESAVGWGKEVGGGLEWCIVVRWRDGVVVEGGWR